MDLAIHKVGQNKQNNDILVYTKPAHKLAVN